MDQRQAFGRIGYLRTHLCDCQGLFVFLCWPCEELATGAPLGDPAVVLAAISWKSSDKGPVASVEAIRRVYSDLDR